MITKVSLKNWRSHENTSLEFGNGTNALLGIIGSGKSSVLDAICFCLFGTFPTLQARKLKIEDLIMKKPIEKSNAEVEVSFVENGRNYSVKRMIERGKGTVYSEVKENGRTVESPNTSRVNELVERLLKVHYDLFSKAIYSEQNSLDYFLTIQRGSRMKKIDELLGIDKFEKARMNAVSLKNKLEERKENKQVQIDSSNVEEARKNIAALKSAVDVMRTEKSALDSKLTETSATRMKIEKEISDSRKLKQNLEDVKREEKAMSTLIEDTYNSLKNLEDGLKDKDKDQAEKSLREVSRYLSEMEILFRDEQKKYIKLQDQATKAKTEVEVIRREKLDRLENEIKRKLEAKQILKEKKLDSEKIDEEIDEKKKLIEKFFGEMEVTRMKIEELQKTIDQINEVESKCPLCDTKITKEKKVMLIKKKKFEIEDLKENLAKAAKKSDISKKEIEDLEATASQLEDLLDAVKGLDDIQTELNNTKNVYSVLEEQALNFEKELLVLRHEVDSIDKKIADARGKKEEMEITAVKAREYNEKKSKIESLLSQRKIVESSIKSLQQALVGKEDIQLENEWRRLLTEEKTMAGRVGGLSEIISEKELRMKELQDRIAGAEKIHQEIKSLDKSIEDMKIFEKALESTQLQLRKEFVASVNYTMNELWPNLYPYHDFSRVQLSVEEGDYVLQLQEKSGKWVNVEGFASGGERSIAALTLRIAFALVLAPQLKWLVLDEPTANMDVKAVEDLAVTLSEHIGNFIDQTFLITHDEKLEGAVTGFAYKFERDKANDGYTKVIQL